MSFSFARLFFRLAVATATFLTAWPSFAAGDEDAVQRLLIKTFDKPEARLNVDPVVVNGDVAVAGWVQGDLGGRAFLRRKGDQWTIDLCAGDALKDSASLERLGLEKARAASLASRINNAERKLDPLVLKKLSSFDRVFAVDEKGAHTPVDPHHRPFP
jgi:hypothetical protein